MIRSATYRTLQETQTIKKHTHTHRKKLPSLEQQTRALASRYFHSKLPLQLEKKKNENREQKITLKFVVLSLLLDDFRTLAGFLRFLLDFPIVSACLMRI
ncbi:hypothetical protein RDI58_010450 [Solanum bulbocastanum]|uniref:Uncharacterized protein n=1 Tax=Solanum bulbocastanum TaxID=147425 RepID=A0AAN8TPG2_SOLBU